MSRNTMSRNYYTRNGYTGAANLGWDQPIFFPMGSFLCDYDDSVVAGTVESTASLSWNTLWAYGSIDTSAVAANNISVVYLTGVALTSGSFTNLVGLETYDEPPSYAAGVSTPIGGTLNSYQDTCFWWVNCTWSYIWGFFDGILSGAPAPGTPTSVVAQLVTTPSGKQRHIDTVSADIYWFTGSRDPNYTPFMPSVGQDIYGLGSPATADQTSRGSNYGDTVDVIRSYQTGNYPAPIGIYVETGDPFWGTGSVNSDVITPPEFNWACWSAIIHGARQLYFFDHFGPSSGGNIDDNLTDPLNTFYRTAQAGQSVSMFAQAEATCGLIANLARIINSPFALGYASVSPAGYAFPMGTKSLAGGVEICCHWYQGGTFTNSAGTFQNGFYIFADLRYGESSWSFPVSATFTVNDSNATSVNVVGESRSIMISGGRFTDSFATAATVHIYQVNG